MVDASLCFVGMYEGIKGKTYFFDSMWIPFLKPLQSFEGKTDNYEELKTVFYASLDIIKFLLGEGYEVRLFLNSVGEEKTFMHNKRTIMLSELNEQTYFDWATIYELFIPQN